ncbi:MAG TPA: hypothetical protein VF952_01245 [Chloroflexia bacterium]|jgi:hypothetical protein
MKHRVLLLAALLALASLFFAGAAWADSPAPAHDYTVVTEDGQYILVMIADNAKGAYNQRGYPMPDETIRAKYSQAGLYKNDGSTTPVWTIDWYSFGVELSSDGQHLVQYGPWAWADDYDELALAFHKNGRLLTQYSVADLVTFPWTLPSTVSHYTWLKDSTFDDAKAQLHIETKSGEKYIFDVKTGKVISGTLAPAKQGPLVLGLVVAFVGVIVLVAVLFVLRTRR